MRAYSARPEIKARAVEYRKTPRAVAAKKAYESSERGKAKKREQMRKVFETNDSYRQYRREYMKAWLQTPEGRRQRDNLKIRYRESGRWNAYNALRRALRSGDLVRQPCKKCGAEKTHAHHHDYGKPLDVEWLCSRHHREEHRAY
jgi:hypothetical protein